MNLITAELSDKQFRKISRIVHELSGIHLKEGKEALVRARLMKRLRALNMNGFGEYLKFIESDPGKMELMFMVEVMTTNKTSFFREKEHFNYLKDHVLPKIKGYRMRFWTAACSSGEEPYTLSILLHEHLPNIGLTDVKILGTDISTKMLKKAQTGVYGEETIKDVPKDLLLKYFERVDQNTPRLFRLKPNVKSIVKLAWLNLMDNWPMKGPFNVIFCRNVMIYFDRETQQRLVNRFHSLIEPGGYLFVGHSEGLSAISHRFQYIKPAVYRK